MNNDPVYQRLREIAWRRKLTAAEQAELRAWLATHPEATAECEIDFALDDALARLPDAPAPSNFTARVLQGIEREAMQSAPRPKNWAWVWRVLVPRAAVAMVVVGVAAFALQQHRTRTRIGTSVATVVGVPTLPSPEALEDFDVIQKLGSEPVADTELLALLK